MSNIAIELIQTAREPHHLREAIKKGGHSSYSEDFCASLRIKAQELMELSHSKRFRELVREIVEDHEIVAQKFNDELAKELSDKASKEAIPLSVAPQPVVARSLGAFQSLVLASSERKYLVDIPVKGENNLLDKVRCELLIHVIKNSSSATEASRVLGVSYKTLYNLLRKYSGENHEPSE